MFSRSVSQRVPHARRFRMQGLALLVAAYALSPIDLNPDFIPMLGYLDNVVLSPLGLALMDKPTTPEVLASARSQSEHAATDHSAIPQRRLSPPYLSRCLLFCKGYLRLNTRPRTEGNPDTAIISLHPEIARAYVTAAFSGSLCLSINSAITGDFKCRITQYGSRLTPKRPRALFTRPRRVWLTLSLKYCSGCRRPNALSSNKRIRRLKINYS